jgi:hypothetical protein
MSMDESRNSEKREIILKGLSKIWNGELVRIRSHGNMGVRKSIGDDIRSWHFQSSWDVGLTILGCA